MILLLTNMIYLQIKMEYMQWHEIIHLNISLGAKCLDHCTKTAKSPKWRIMEGHNVHKYNTLKSNTFNHKLLSLHII